MSTVTNTIEQCFSLEGMEEDIKKLYRKLNEIERVADGDVVRQIMFEAGEILSTEQKRILSTYKSKQKSPKLSPDWITVTVTKGKGYWKVAAGYKTDIIKEHIEVVILEFGRPGAKGKKKGGIVSSGKYKGRKIGVIQPFSHIRAAKFNKGEYIKQYIGRRLFEEIKRRWEAA